ncbi:MAG: DNA/RNA nuclease SfsA [Candidatus Lokiarchaeota archaeon]|nr:DNA/RNA nuclease SfsA [Candidatus Lokiarchaeota archaeon]
MIPLFRISNLYNAQFIDRPNRFVANIKYNGNLTQAHIHDPGRLNELLQENANLLMVPGTKKLPWYVKAVQSKTEEWVLIDSALHNRISRAIFPLIEEFRYVKEIRSEVPIGKSRIDFMMDGIPLEVKGVSLIKENNIAYFPDAPTERGARHVYEIIQHNGMLLFLIFHKAAKFSPNFEMDPKFGTALSFARKKTIPIICAQIHFDGKTVFYDGKVPLSEF